MLQVIRLSLVALSLASSTAARASQPGPGIPAADAPGTTDSRYLPRYDGARLIASDRLDDEQATLPTGPFRDFGFAGVRTIDGEVSRHAYVVPRMVSTMEVMRFFHDALQGAGFTTSYSCSGAGPTGGCGGFGFGELLTQPMVEAHAGEAGGLIIDFLHPVGDDIRYVLASADRPGARVTLALAIARHVGREPGIFIETVREPTPIRQPAATAPLIAAALRTQGHIALYGLRFMADTAVLASGWRPVLAPAAALLQANPDMRLMVVGHTGDDRQTVADAMRLSDARANRVMQVLVANWRIPAGQVTAMGVGPAAPLTADDDTAGQALNRRIELVAQPPGPARPDPKGADPGPPPPSVQKTLRPVSGVIKPSSN
ncbi:OmpA family protein [Lichenicoccus roseus]|uniref:OmpA family protein n=1 Tax=Lichenicoccus roseus TaxID=2683649 RepID=A0A5R9J3D5_9PROT|nr:OmpA family protein [Lichenicoccus roseus]TLU72135.1 OmpA family protein [Lichenicoccus roseus]